jgi:hypothetical protein
MPTALLQLNKTVYQETKESLIQRPLQKMNDNYPPTILLGPIFARLTSFPTLSDRFHEAAQGRSDTIYSFQRHESDTEFVAYEIASWYNDRVSPRHALGLDISNDTQHSADDVLHTFAGQTLKRMKNTNFSEVKFRILLSCSESKPARPAED